MLSAGLGPLNNVNIQTKNKEKDRKCVSDDLTGWFRVLLSSDGLASTAADTDTSLQIGRTARTVHTVGIDYIAADTESVAHIEAEAEAAGASAPARAFGSFDRFATAAADTAAASVGRSARRPRSDAPTRRPTLSSPSHHHQFCGAAQAAQASKQAQVQVHA